MTVNTLIRAYLFLTVSSQAPLNGAVPWDYICRATAPGKFVIRAGTALRRRQAEWKEMCPGTVHIPFTASPNHSCPPWLLSRCLSTLHHAGEASWCDLHPGGEIGLVGACLDGEESHLVGRIRGSLENGIVDGLVGLLLRGHRLLWHFAMLLLKGMNRVVDFIRHHCCRPGDGHSTASGTIYPITP